MTYRLFEDYNRGMATEGLVERLCGLLIRPSRQEYLERDLDNNFIGRKTRVDFNVRSQRGLKIEASFFKAETPMWASHAVIYLHSFNGSRLESISYARDLNQLGANFCCFDFCGSGKSEGQFVSMGYHEAFDVRDVVRHLNLHFGVTCISLWGRSMGAVSAIKYHTLYNDLNRLDSNPSRIKICTMVLDSPFCSLTRLIVEITQKLLMCPGFLVKAAISMFKPTIEAKVDFKISQLELKPELPSILCPTMIVASKNDTLINSTHSDEIYEGLTNSKEKTLVYICSSHNEARRKSDIQMIYSWLLKTAPSTSTQLGASRLKSDAAKSMDYLSRKSLPKYFPVVDDPKDRERPFVTVHCDRLHFYKSGITGLRVNTENEYMSRVFQQNSRSRKTGYYQVEPHKQSCPNSPIKPLHKIIGLVSSKEEPKTFTSGGISLMQSNGKISRKRILSGLSVRCKEPSVKAAVKGIQLGQEAMKNSRAMVSSGRNYESAKSSQPKHSELPFSQQTTSLPNSFFNAKVPIKGNKWLPE